MQKLKQIIDLCVKGLTTDGAHHKQWYLEEILKTLGPNTEKLNPNESIWEKGIPN